MCVAKRDEALVMAVVPTTAITSGPAGRPAPTGRGLGPFVTARSSIVYGTNAAAIPSTPRPPRSRRRTHGVRRLLRTSIGDRRRLLGRARDPRRTSGAMNAPSGAMRRRASRASSLKPVRWGSRVFGSRTRRGAGESRPHEKASERPSGNPQVRLKTHFALCDECAAQARGRPIGREPSPSRRGRLSICH